MTDKMVVTNYDDSITEHITPKFFEDVYYVQKKGINDYQFLLYNPFNRTTSYMEIVCAHINSVGQHKNFKITGSLRAWWFGYMSLNDFSMQEYEEAVKYLLFLLDIPISEMKHFILSGIEVGMNFFLKVPCSEIICRIVFYNKSCYTRNSYGETGICYETRTYRKFFKLYNKIEKIARDFKKKRYKSVEEEQFLKDYKDKDVTRIEFNIEKPARIKKELGFSNLEDSIIHFDELYSYFWKQIQLVQFSDAFVVGVPIVESPINGLLDFKECMAKIGIKVSGRVYVNGLIKQIKNRNARVDSRKFVEGISDGTCIYDKYVFLMNIKSQLLKSMQKSRCLFIVKKLFLKKPVA